VVLGQRFHRAAQRDHRAVDIDGAVVTLRGTVESLAEHDAAIGTAGNTPGVSRVVDQLEVA
ncbi:MAG: BON domain-containing protein, partial [Comamonadaceae bacterium]